MSQKEQIPEGLYRQKNPKTGEFYSIWWTCVKGYRESTKTDDRKEAERILKVRIGKAAEGQPLIQRLDQISYEEGRKLLIDYYITSRKRNLEEAGYRLKHLDGFFKKKKLIAVDDHQEEYIEKRWAEGAADATINRDLETLIKMLHVAYEKKKLSRIPVIHKLTLNNIRGGFFEEEMFLRVRHLLREDYQVAVTIAKVYGWRMQSEILPLEWRRVDLHPKVGTLRLDPGTTKNDKGRLVYLTAELYALLTAQLQRVQALERSIGKIIPWVFPHVEGKFRGEQIKDFKKAWKTACQKAGCPGMLRHDFRRTAVRNFERAGVPRSIAMKNTGHQTESVYGRYDIVDDADQRLSRDMLETHSRLIVGAPPLHQERENG